MVNYIIKYKGFKVKDRIKKRKHLKNLIESHGFNYGELNYVFLDDEGLLEINQKYLNHDTYTDIITFDYSDDEETIEAEILISIDRIKENAENFGVGFENELIRVMSHGVLHLLGYNDETPEEESEMRAAEEKALESYFNN